MVLFYLMDSFMVLWFWFGLICFVKPGMIPREPELRTLYISLARS
jgi:hypothetical protein